MKKHNSGLSQTKVALMPEVPSQVPSKQPSYQAVVGLDVSDRRTHYCMMDLDGGLALEDMVATKELPLRLQFAGKPGPA